MPLDEAIALWERGEELYRLCRTRLDAAQGKIEELASASRPRSRSAPRENLNRIRLPWPPQPELLKQRPALQRPGRQASWTGSRASFKERTFDAGDTIASEGSSGIGFFVIGEGEAAVTVHGTERATLGPGDYFGEVALIDEGQRSASIVAKTPVTCYGLTAWEFRPFVESNGKIAWKLLQTLAKRLRAAEQRESSSSTRSSRARAGSPLSARASTPAATRSTTPPKTTPRTPAALGGDEHGRRRLALERRRVDRALAGDDEVGALEPSEADQVEHELGARRRALRRAPQAPRRARRPRRRRGAARRARGRLGPPAARSSSSTAAGVGALLRPERPRGAARRRAAGCARRRRPWPASGKPPNSASRPRPPSTVAVPPRQTSSASAPSSIAAWSSSPSPRLDARSGSRSSGATRPSPIASAASTTAVPSGEHEPPRLDRPPERVGDGRASATRRRARTQEHGRPSPRRRRRPAPRRLSACAPEPSAERGGRLGRRQDALEARRSGDARARCRRADGHALALELLVEELLGLLGLVGLHAASAPRTRSPRARGR